ncbi:hypothetical protein ApDm4_2545 [Acetobacter pomorum]|nr:hypothetical protein ApDm4_2545 [Acetobacter pomorum]
MQIGLFYTAWGKWMPAETGMADAAPVCLPLAYGLFFWCPDATCHE